MAAGCCTLACAATLWAGAHSSQTPQAQTPQGQVPQPPNQGGQPGQASAAQPGYDTVGPIEGEAISVQGPLNIEVVHGQTRTILRSGSDVRVNSGQARIDLVEGGQLVICGPSHFSVLKSVNLLTIALDSGILHARIEHLLPILTIYTAQLQIKPVIISDAAQDLLIGFDATGAMCIHPSSGAVRVEQQLTAQNIIVPQGGDIVIADAKLETLLAGTGRCACDLQLAKVVPPPPELEISRPTTAEEVKKDAAEAAKLPRNTAKPAIQEPVYQVFMPPLSYDASAKLQRDDFDPSLIVMVRHVRVRPTLIFQGRVEESTGAKNSTRSQAPAGKPPSSDGSAPSSGTQPLPPRTSLPSAPVAQPKNPPPPRTLSDRARALFRRIFS